MMLLLTERKLRGQLFIV